MTRRYILSTFILLLALIPSWAQFSSDSLIRSKIRVIKDIEPNDPIVLPEQLDEQLEELLHKWYSGYTIKGTNQSKRIPLSNIPTIPDSVYINKLDHLPSMMRMSYNPLVREAIELYIYKRRSLLSSMLSLADLYFPDIEMALDRYGLPLELKYLTIIESSLNPQAVSPVGATGLWQLMLPTGRAYGLTINSLIDERYSPVRSTDAACRLLKELYRMYGDWWLAIAAYNCGPGNVNRAIKRAGVKTNNFWDIYHYLPRETKRYVPLFIGAYFAMYYHADYGIKAHELGRPLATDYYTVRENTTLDKLAKLTDTDVELLKLYNPHFRRNVIPGHAQPYEVRLPVSAIAKLEDIEDGLVVESLSVALEGPSGASATSNAKPADDATGKPKYHKVKKGETLNKIARKYGTTANKIKQLNGLKTNSLKAGQSIIVSK